VSVSNDKGYLVKDAAINLRLQRESCKSVAVTLELESADFSVDHCDVDTNGAGPDPHFIYD